MSELKGILVRLKSGPSDNAGTTDRLYLGVVGSAGGREFPLDAPGFDDHQKKNREVTYWVGEVSDGDVPSGAVQIVRNHRNRTGVWRVDFGQVNQVYLRKWGHTKMAEDDACQLKEVEVTLHGPGSNIRTFKRTETVWLGAEYGLQVWIPEVWTRGDAL